MLIKMNIESVLRSSSLMMTVFIIVLIQICCATSLDGVTLQFNKRGKHCVVSHHGALYEKSFINRCVDEALKRGANNE
jgi:hypothetical protein